MIVNAIDTHISMLYKNAEVYKTSHCVEAQIDCLNEINKYKELRKEFE